LHAVLVVCGLLTVVPLLWMVSASIMSPGEANTYPPPLLPHAATLANYVTLFTRLNIARALANSVLITVATTCLSLLVTALAGYAFAKLRFAGRDRLFGILLAGLVVPTQVGMLPLFLLLRGMHLVNTPLGVIIPGLASILGIFLIRQYALSIPDDLLDAARIDGGGEGQIFRTIAIPLLGPILVTQAVFTFLGTWNDFLWPLVVLSDSSKYTLPVALANLVGEHVQDTELMMAGAVLTVLPVMIVFFVLQRFYIRGVMMGSVKG
jgi:multiple sugar transport system permease protein